MILCQRIHAAQVENQTFEYNNDQVAFKAFFKALCCAASITPRIQRVPQSIALCMVHGGAVDMLMIAGD